MKLPLTDRKYLIRKYLIVDWNPVAMKRTGLFRFRHRRNVRSIYLRLFALEVVVWYGDTTRCSGTHCKKH